MKQRINTTKKKSENKKKNRKQRERVNAGKKILKPLKIVKNGLRIIKTFQR